MSKEFTFTETFQTRVVSISLEPRTARSNDDVWIVECIEDKSRRQEYLRFDADSCPPLGAEVEITTTRQVRVLAYRFKSVRSQETPPTSKPDLEIQG